MSKEQEMREAFEDTYRSRLILDRRESGEYVFTRAFTAWDAWQAATLASEARIRELEADAKRYRHVRNSCGDYVRYAGGGCHYLLEAEDLDAAIDAALTEHKENQG